MSGDNKTQSLADRINLENLLSEGEKLEFSGRNGFFTSKRAFLMSNGFITVVPYENIKYTQIQEPKEEAISLIGEAFVILLGIVFLSASLTAPIASVQAFSGFIELLCLFIGIGSSALKLSKQTQVEAKTTIVLEDNERFTIYSSEAPWDALQTMGKTEHLKIESVN